MVKRIILMLSLLAFAPAAVAESLETWVSGEEFDQYSLLSKKNVEGSYFAIFRSNTKLIVASRKLVEIGSTGGHRMRFEIYDENGADLVSSNACPKKELKNEAVPCGEYFCDVDTAAYPLDFENIQPRTYRLRWQWIKADVLRVEEVRGFIDKYLQSHELPVIMEGKVSGIDS